MRELLLGIDLGTSAVKTGLFTPEGELVRFARQAYPLLHPDGEGAVEQDPEQWWMAARTCIRNLLAEEDAARLRAICVGGQGPTLVLVDSRGKPIRNAISYLDTRSGPQATRLAQAAASDRIAYSLLPRLMWVKETEPDTYARARWALQAWDFLGYRLSGARAAVASTFDGDTVWSESALEVAGLDGSPLIPPLVPAGRVYGETGGRWIDEARVPAGIPIVGGINDGIGSIVGAAGLVVGRATDPGGAGGGVGLCWDRAIEAPGVGCWPGLIPGTCVLGGAFAGIGRALEWWASVGAQRDVPSTVALAEQAPAGSKGLVFLPFLDGERSPLWDREARGAFLGLSFEHGAPELARAVLESGGYALRLLVEAITSGGARVDELRVCGGPAQSRLWNQIKCDVTGLPTAVPRVTEVALMGNAVCAAIGAGFYPDLLTASERMVQIAERRAPDPAATARYDELFSVYRQAYHALKPLFPVLGRV